jgi:hypothetical protein
LIDVEPVAEPENVLVVRIDGTGAVSAPLGLTNLLWLSEPPPHDSAEQPMTEFGNVPVFMASLWHNANRDLCHGAAQILNFYGPTEEHQSQRP